MIALDTNLLVYAHRAGVPEHAQAQRLVEQACDAADGCAITVQTLAEFWAVVTHPATRGGPSEPRQAERFLRALEEDGGVQLLTPGPRFGARLRQAALDLGVRGPRVFDLAIGLCALDGGADELWTRDAHFVRLPGLRLRDPFEPRRR